MITNPSSYEFTNIANNQFIQGAQSTDTMRMRLEHYYWWNELTRTAEAADGFDPDIQDARYLTGLGSKDSVEEMIPNINHILHVGSSAPKRGWADRLNAVITKPYYEIKRAPGLKTVISEYNDKVMQPAQWLDWIGQKIEPAAISFPDKMLPNIALLLAFKDAKKATIDKYSGGSYPDSSIKKSNYYTGMGRFPTIDRWDGSWNQAGYALGTIFYANRGHWNNTNSPEYTWINETDTQKLKPYKLKNMVGTRYYDTGFTGMYFNSYMPGAVATGTWAWEDDYTYNVEPPPWHWSRNQMSNNDMHTRVEFRIAYILYHRAVWRKQELGKYVFNVDPLENIRYIIGKGSVWYADRQGDTETFSNSYGMSNLQIGNECCDIANVDTLPAQGYGSGWTRVGYLVYVNPYAVIVVGQASGRGIGD